MPKCMPIVFACLIFLLAGKTAQAGTRQPVSQYFFGMSMTEYVQYRTAYGEVLPITGNTVQIGYVPILLENQNAGGQVKKLVLKRRVKYQATNSAL